MSHAISLYNTATRRVEPFSAHADTVTMYHCGPTVYSTAHIGNLRSYVFADVLRRTLEHAGYQVKQIINITDVGHLVGDGDEGEDKMTTALKREGLPLTKESMTAVGERYTADFLRDLDLLNILPAHGYPRASAHIAQDVTLIETLLSRGHAYRTDDGVYFDTSTFPTYPDFARLDVSGLRAGERVDMGSKRHPTDFALWKYDANLGYNTPIGAGFPGWHIECSAMIHEHLGHPIDIHTGGIDHIPVHHTNEIAQSVSAYGAPFVQTWMHNAHMTVDGAKMSKSLHNTYTLADLAARDITPMGFRYFLLQASYRTQINFTWEAVRGAEEAYNKLRERIYRLKHDAIVSTEPRAPQHHDAYTDLSTASMIARIHEALKHERVSTQVIQDIEDADRILGLQLCAYTPARVSLTPRALDLMNQREVARRAKDFAQSDALRDALLREGYVVKDTKDGQVVERA